MNTLCDICGDPAGDTAYACTRCTNHTASRLADVINLAGDVETTVARQARYATRGGHRAQPVEPEEAGKSPGGLRPTPLPVDLNASYRSAAAFNTVTTWARHVSEERGVNLPEPARGVHPIAAAARFLVGQLDWLRHRPEAAEALGELAAAGAVIRRVVDAPPEMVIVGVCDCGAHLYAYLGANACTCQECKASWDVQASRDSLMEALRDRLVTAAEGATLVVLVYPEEQRSKVRDMIRSWARPERGHLTEHVGIDGPMYPFGEIIDRVTRHVLAKKQHPRVTVTVK